MVLSFQRTIPTLVELCVQSAIDNIRYLGDVGETDIHLLKDILPHCTLDQLMYIEDSSKGRDLSPVTDNLWKRFYEIQFGAESVNVVIRRMKQKKVVFKWRLLYEAKLKERDEAQKKSVDRLKKLYEEEGARKQSRQIQICSKVPPSSKRRFFSGDVASCSNGKGSLMKKAKMEYLNRQYWCTWNLYFHYWLQMPILVLCMLSIYWIVFYIVLANSHEVKVHLAMKKKELQRKSFSTSSVSKTMKPSSFLGKSPASNSRLSEPFGRR